jgi:hypothetical protein
LETYASYTVQLGTINFYRFWSNVFKGPQYIGNILASENTGNIRITTVKVSYKTIKIETKL